MDLPLFSSSSSSSFLLHLRKSPDIAEVGLDLMISLSPLLECSDDKGEPYMFFW